VVARELTKQFEEIVTATPAEHLERLRANEPRGEFVVVLPGKVTRAEEDD
jgi:16S rRNA C1402 (ribose-2'-O) methylase RsmI